MADYEARFVKEVVSMLRRADLHLLEEPRHPYREVIKGSRSSEADGVIVVDTATIILEIDKKGVPSDNVVKYHRALALNLLRPPVRQGRLILVQAFITKNIRPLRVENAKHMGKLLNRDYGAFYISAESKAEDIADLIRQIEPPLLHLFRHEATPTVAGGVASKVSHPEDSQSR